MEEDEEAGKPSVTGFDHVLPENCAEYLVTLIGHPQMDMRQQLAELDTIRKAWLHECRTLTKDYIWQKDDLRIETKIEKGLVYLHGISDYGDAIEDEWLIVYLLRELSKSYPNTWVRVFDTDGEFLLIEAANVLPKWLNPEMDRHRVWINKGKLFIIPRKNGQEGYRLPSITLPEAIEFIKTTPQDLVQDARIEEEAFYRLKKYPRHIAESLHFARVTLPRKLCYLLHEIPRSVAPAVESFYLRDAPSLKAVQSVDSDLNFPPEDLVTVSVRFSKVLYAQLRSQRFETPPRWRKLLETSSGDQSQPASSADRSTEKMELGMKLTCGFEMLARQAAQSASPTVREVALLLQDVDEDGPTVLPDDAEIASWEHAEREDSDAWMDINYEDFEAELDGKPTRTQQPTTSGNGFGSAQTQDDLRRIVSKFEAFLKDDSAGVEGAEVDEMDVNDDDDDDDDMSSNNEENDAGFDFDAEEFTKILQDLVSPSAVRAKGPSGDDVESPDEDAEALQDLASQFEQELKGHGALQLDTPQNRKPPRHEQAFNGSREGGSLANIPESNVLSTDAHAGEPLDDEDDEVDIDYNLAKNLLESFKSQSGMSGPTSNLLGMMGIQLPRDEADASPSNNNVDEHDGGN